MPHSGYQPPDGGIYVSDPRTPSDIIIRSLLIHVFALIAFVHLLVLRRWPLQIAEGVQALAFLLFPEFVIVLLVWGCVGAGGKMVRRRGRGSSRRVEVEVAVGVGVGVGVDGDGVGVTSGRGRTKVLEHLLGVGLNAAPLILTVMAYKQRLGMRYRSATYVANLGIDHANGRAAISGIIAIVLSLATLIMSSPSKRPQQPNNETDSFRPKDDEAPEPKGMQLQDLSAFPCSSQSHSSHSRSSSLALLQHSLSPSQTQPHSIHSSLQNAYIPYLQLLLAGLLHQIPLALTNHTSILSLRQLSRNTLIERFAILYFLTLVAYVRRHESMFTWKRWALGCVTLGLLVQLVVQLRDESAELRDVRAGRVEPWNYRWKVRDWGSGRW